MGTLDISEPKTRYSTFQSEAISRTPKKAGQICSSEKQEKVPEPTVSTLQELVMFHMYSRRRFRNESRTKNAGSPEMLGKNKGREFAAS